MGNVTRSVFAGSAHFASPAAGRATASAATASAAATRRTALLTRRLAPLAVDVIVGPGVPVERVVLVAHEPRLHEHVFVTVRMEIPRCVDRDELRHPLQDLRSLRSVRHGAR